MKKVFAVALGVLTAIGGFVDIGDLVTNALVGARFGLSLAWVVVVGVLGICVFAEMSGRVAAVSGRATFDLIRERRLGLLGAAAYWGFDIAVLGLSLKAFGASVALAVLVMGYFLGTLGSLLPLPGGIGGVEGGLIGAFAAFGVPVGRALVGVLAYRAISFWLPTLPGVVGYVKLRSRVREWRESDVALVAATEGEHSDV